MIHYTISYNNPHRHFVDFEFSTTTNGREKIQFQLAAWRPGRYELANFSQNIQKWGAFDENQNPLSFKNTFILGAPKIIGSLIPKKGFQVFSV